MFDWDAFRKISYGLYLITAADKDGHKLGCVANTFQQITVEPPQVSVTLNKTNATTGAILETGKFAVTALSKDAEFKLIGTFGFRTSYDFDEFEGVDHQVSDAMVPYVCESAVARFEMDVVQTIDVGTHLIIVGLVTESELLSDGEPMTYAHYHEVKGGKTPPKASSYIPPVKTVPLTGTELRSEINAVESEMAKEVAEAIEESLEKGQ